MAQEAFKAAGDPKIFPEQIAAGLRPWTPLKDYARVPFRMRPGGPAVSTNVEISEGDYDPILGMSYVQLSREGLGFQKSQNGGGSIPNAGQFLSPYHRFESNVQPAADKESNFFDGIDTSLLGIATLAGGGDSEFLKAGLGRINAAVEKAVASLEWLKKSREGLKLRAPFAGLITQLPGGELIDITKARRALVGAGAAAVAVALLVIALRFVNPTQLVSRVKDQTTAGAH